VRNPPAVVGADDATNPRKGGPAGGLLSRRMCTHVDGLGEEEPGTRIHDLPYELADAVHNRARCRIFPQLGPVAADGHRMKGDPQRGATPATTHMGAFTAVTAIGGITRRAL
jgi:hypothetical protein